MSRFYVSGSKLDRLMQCLGSLRLPWTHQVDDGEPAERGTELHLFLKRVSAMPIEKALEQVPEKYREEASVLQLDKLPALSPESYRAELPLAWNWMTDEARVVTSYDEVDPLTHVVGTLDAAGLTESSAVVLDYKSGRSWLPDPASSLQLRAYALMLARAFNRPRAVVGYILIRDERPRFLTAELHEEALAATADELSGLMARIGGMETNQLPELREGPACTYCPAFARCPAKVALAARIGSQTDDSLATELQAELTPDSAAKAYRRIQMVRQVIDLAESNIKNYARVVGGVPLGDGKVLGPVERTYRNIADVEQAAQVLAGMVGPERAKTAVELSLTWSGIEGAVKSYLRDTTGSTRGVTKVVKELSEKMEQANALSVVKRNEVREHTPKKEKTDGEEG